MLCAADEASNLPLCFWLPTSNTMYVLLIKESKCVTFDDVAKSSIPWGSLKPDYCLNATGDSQMLVLYSLALVYPFGRRFRFEAKEELFLRRQGAAAPNVLHIHRHRAYILVIFSHLDNRWFRGVDQRSLR